MEIVYRQLLDQVRQQKDAEQLLLQGIANAERDLRELKAALDHYRAVGAAYQSRVGVNPHPASGSAPEAVEQTEGVGGRKVVHVEEVDQDDSIRYVWLPEGETTDEQSAFSISRDGLGDQTLLAIEVERCTAAQLAGRTVHTI